MCDTATLPNTDTTPQLENIKIGLVKKTSSSPIILSSNGGVSNDTETSTVITTPSSKGVTRYDGIKWTITPFIPANAKIYLGLYKTLLNILPQPALNPPSTSKQGLFKSPD